MRTLFYVICLRHWEWPCTCSTDLYCRCGVGLGLPRVTPRRPRRSCSLVPAAIAHKRLRSVVIVDELKQKVVTHMRPPDDFDQLAHKEARSHWWDQWHVSIHIDAPSGHVCRFIAAVVAGALVAAPTLAACLALLLIGVPVGIALAFIVPGMLWSQLVFGCGDIRQTPRVKPEVKADPFATPCNMTVEDTF